MKKLLSAIIIICFLSVTLLAGVSNAGWENGNVDGTMIAIGVMLIMLPAMFMGLSASQYAAKQSGWVEANKGDLIIPFLYSEATAFLGKRKIKMKENSWVYPQPNRLGPIGAAYTNERYYIEKEVNNEQGVWYEIKIDADHLTTAEAK
jgi:hypothetical protein